jgi:hypothetical protein
MGCVATSRCNPVQLSILSALMVASAKGIDGDLNKDCTCLTGLSRILSGVTKERFGDRQDSNYILSILIILY